MNKNSWLDVVDTSKVADYILLRFPDAENIEIEAKPNMYFVTFNLGQDVFEGTHSVILQPHMTSIDGYEFDKEWISIVRDCNKNRTIDGWAFDEILVFYLERAIYQKKINSITKIEKEYEQDVKNINELFKKLDIQEKIEEKQI